ncbi:MAG TPA: phytanoyl-CoA dioxygenase family protein [Acidimicrobiales bacterium]
MAMSAVQQRAWRDDGVLIIPGFFSEEEVTAVTDALDRVRTERPRSVTVDDLVTGDRTHASDADFSHAMKVNDIYLEDQRVRDVALSARVGDLLGELLDDVPVLCNTLNLPKGSQQADHLDTLYMTPATPDKLVATWMALEDVHPDAGPLRYFPGSARIPTYRFRDGSLHVDPEEMDAWSEYMADEVDRRGLSEERFLAKRGDLFVWHAWVLHGGSAIEDPSLTRNSLVTHFWSETDSRARGHTLRPVDGGLWFERPPQPVPGEVPADATTEGLAEQAAAERAATEVVDGVPLQPKRSLVDRMKRLVFSSD